VGHDEVAAATSGYDSHDMPDRDRAADVEAADDLLARGISGLDVALALDRCGFEEVAKAVLYCETPSFGSSPGAGGEGEFDPDMEDEDFVADEELQTLGCSGGAGFEGIAMGIGGLVLLIAARRRRT